MLSRRIANDPGLFLDRPNTNLFGPGGSRFLAQLELREAPGWRMQTARADRRLPPTGR